MSVFIRIFLIKPPTMCGKKTMKTAIPISEMQNSVLFWYVNYHYSTIIMVENIPELVAAAWYCHTVHLEVISYAISYQQSDSALFPTTLCLIIPCSGSAADC